MKRAVRLDAHSPGILPLADSVSCALPRRVPSAVIDARAGVAQAAANWIWLVAGASVGPAIFIGESESHVLAALQLHVEVVLTPGGAAPLADLGQAGAAWAYLDLDYARREYGGLRGVLAVLKQAVRADGYLCLANRPVDGRVPSRLQALWKMDQALRMARNAGFSVARRYHVVPDPDAPITLIPANRHGATVHELLAEPVPHRELRLRIARTALYPLLFRGQLCLCSA